MLNTRFARAARAAVIACALGSALLVAGCGKQPPAFQNLDLTGNTQFGSNFSLPDTSGKIRTMADYKGKVVVLFFGYTHCPDVCPTTMAELSQALQQLGPEDARRVQVLFVTVDPERDTPAQLRDYTALFDRRIRGLTGDTKAIAAAARAYRVTYAKYDIQGPLDYRMDHSAFIYLMNRDGRFVARFPQGTAPETLADALRAQLGS